MSKAVSGIMTSWCPTMMGIDPVLPVQHKTAAQPIRDSDFTRYSLSVFLSYTSVRTTQLQESTIGQPYLSIKCTMSSFFSGGQRQSASLAARLQKSTQATLLFAVTHTGCIHLCYYTHLRNVIIPMVTLHNVILVLA